MHCQRLHNEFLDGMTAEKVSGIDSCREFVTEVIELSRFITAYFLKGTSNGKNYFNISIIYDFFGYSYGQHL